MFSSSLLLAALLVQAPTEVTVPAALAAVTAPPELSGLAWDEALQRYLVVSDDTGLRARGTRHAPLLLALSAAGVLDQAPVGVDGLEALDDAEAITRGPGATYFVCTSHSPNHEGQLKARRRALLWLERRERRLVVKGRLDLTQLRDADGRSLSALAAGREESLDLEGLAFRDGALFVGLKAPLGPGGAATIVRLGDALAAFAQGRVAPTAVSVWARPLLEVEDARGQRVPEGISDLSFLPAGGLVVLANAPKSGRPDGGGAAWFLADREAAPRLLQRFRGLKPEGVALSADGRELVVVFDRAQEAPQWTHLPVPR